LLFYCHHISIFQEFFDVFPWKKDLFTLDHFLKMVCLIPNIYAILYLWMTLRKNKCVKWGAGAVPVQFVTMACSMEKIEKP